MLGEKIQEKSTTTASLDEKSRILSGYIYTWRSSIPGTIHLWARMGPGVDFPITTVLALHIIN